MTRKITAWLRAALGTVTATLLGAVLAGAVYTLPAHAQDTPNCDDNAVIRCGVSQSGDTSANIADLKQKFEQNQAGNVQALYQAFGINNEADFDGMVAGRVTSDNQVFAGNTLVADNAFTAGRQNISNDRGSSLDMGGGQFWYRHPSVSFAHPGSLAALIKMDGNTFRFAVILSCGNPVHATPSMQPPPTPPRTPQFQINKDVRLNGQTGWQQNVTAKPGDKLDFRIVVRASGDSDVQNITVRDTLPSGISAVAGSIVFSSGQTASGDLFGSGVTLPVIGKNQQIEIDFTATVDSVEATNNCIQLRNMAFAMISGGQQKQDDAIVSVCQPAATPTVTTTASPAAPTAVLTASTSAAAQPSIPNTGPADLLMIFGLSAAGGGLWHYFIRGRRLLKQN